MSNKSRHQGNGTPKLPRTMAAPAGRRALAANINLIIEHHTRFRVTPGMRRLATAIQGVAGADVTTLSERKVMALWESVCAGHRRKPQRVQPTGPRRHGGRLRVVPAGGPQRHGALGTPGMLGTGA